MLHNIFIIKVNI